MGRFYCDYCDIYLTHDSQAGRKQHMHGRRHQENVRQYYSQFLSNTTLAPPMMGMMPGMPMMAPPMPFMRPPFMGGRPPFMPMPRMQPMQMQPMQQRPNMQQRSNMPFPPQGPPPSK
mmetsp:Transcript_7076/g.10801  ORF Transcript_7076/g.10801 Transcript_7076/m.10801 type:complete len:117 (+) Transcript_7076:133-483(+)